MELAPIAQDLFWHHYLVHVAPKEVANTLKRVDRTNTSANLEKRHRDIAYEVTMQEGHKRLMCAEHQSKPDITIAARFLRYSAGNLENHFSQCKEIPFITNMLLYNGDTSPYPYHNTLQAYYPNPAVGSQDLTLRFHLIDLTQISDEKLLTHGHCAPMEILLKHGRSANFELSVDAYRDVFQACVATVGNTYLVSMLDYAALLHDGEVGKDIYKFIEQIFGKKDNTIMTYGKQLIQQGKKEGIQQGKKEGIQQGKQEGKKEGIFTVAKNMLHNLHMGMDVVQQATGLSRQELAVLAR